MYYVDDEKIQVPSILEEKAFKIKGITIQGHSKTSRISLTFVKPFINIFINLHKVSISIFPSVFGDVRNAVKHHVYDTTRRYL